MNVYYARNLQDNTKYWTTDEKSYRAVKDMSNYMTMPMLPMFDRDAWRIKDGVEVVVSGLMVSQDRPPQWRQILDSEPPAGAKPIFGKTLDELFKEDDDG